MLQGPLPQPQADGWTPERIARLPDLWADKTLSADRIGKLLGGGLSKNAIIGRANRMGLPPRGKSAFLGLKRGGHTVVVAARAARAAASPQPRPVSLARPPAAPAPEPEDEPVILIVLEDPEPDAPGKPWPGKPGECKDIISMAGHSDTWRVCGEPTGGPAAPWCPKHAAIFAGSRR